MGHYPKLNYVLRLNFDFIDRRKNKYYDGDMFLKHFFYRILLYSIYRSKNIVC